MTIPVQLAFLAALPLIAFVFLTQKPHVAASASIVFGCLLLPAARGFDLPLLPTIDQSALPVLMSFVMLCAVGWPLLARAKIGQGPEICIALVIVACVVTNLTNGDPQVFGSRVLSAMQPTDTINDSLRFIIRWGLPFVIGRAVVRSAEDLREVLLICVLGGVMYLPLASMELLTGPILHKMVYGAHPNPYTFSQQIKFGGFRPVVFMTHGLNFASFMLVAASAGVILTKVRHRLFGFSAFPIALVLVLMLIPARTVGVWVYALITLPLMAFARPKLQTFVAVAMAAAVLGYPMLRAAGGVPVEAMHEITVEYVGDKSAHSLFGRLRTEEEILERTRERMAFGWGGYGRYQIFDAFTGESLSILDGFWVITIGEGGAVRLGLIFAMLLLPIVSAHRSLSRIQSEAARRMIGGLALMMAVRAVDLIPNSGVEGYLTFLCGSLSGAVRGELLNRNRSLERQPAAEDIPEQGAKDAREPGGLEPEPALSSAMVTGTARTRKRETQVRPQPVAQPAATRGGPTSLGALAAQGPAAGERREQTRRRPGDDEEPS
ncbi:MAG: hypothetical protein AB8G23_15675 [Myxococcota bacterium]